MDLFMSKIKKIKKALKVKNIKSVLRYIKNNGFKGLGTTCINYIRFGKVILDEYATWINNNEPNEQMLEEQREYNSCQNIQLEIILETDNTEQIESVNKQTYSKYKITTKLKEDILENTKSDYIILVGKNIEIAPFALYEIVRTIEEKDAILYYSDNDLKIDGKRKNPLFKPDFAINTLLSKNYIGDMLVIKTKYLKRYPELLRNLNKDIFYDLLLRISEKTEDIVHISKILYHQTIEEQEIDTESQKKSLKQYLERNQIKYKEIKDGMYPGNYKIEYSIIENPKVSLVVPNKDHIDDLKKLIQSIEKSTYENYELVIVENNSEQKETFEYYKNIVKENPKIRVEKMEIQYFNYSAIVNYGVEKTTGKYIILLNNDIEILTEDWIEQMLMYVQKSNVGICGIKLYFPDRSIQHAGVTIGTRGLAGHRARETEEKDFKETDYINIVQELSAVTAACLMVEKELYLDLLGFDEKLAVAFNDVDFCMKVRKRGLLIVYNPFAYGYHYESKSRGEDTRKSRKARKICKRI